MALTNRLNLPAPLLAAIQNDDHISQGSDIGASSVSAPVRQLALVRKHRDEINADVSEGIWRLFGKAVHVVLADAGRDQNLERRKVDDALALVRSLPGGSLTADAERALERLQDYYPASPQPFRTFIEERWEIEVLGWKVAARCDHLTLDNEGVLTDWKVSSVWSVKGGEPKDDWTAQTNITRYCATRNGIPRPKRLACTVFLRDWRKNERLRYGDEYPAVQVATVGVEYWTDEQCQAYLERRITMHQEAARAVSGESLDERLPLCTPAERWETPTTFAVMKKGRKTAVKLYDKLRNGSELNARTLADGHARTDSALSVVVRPGQSPRCAQYCDALPFCDQGRKIVESLKGAPSED